MMKFKKIFLMGLLAAAVGLFVPSCVDPEPSTSTGYTVTITGGYIFDFYDDDISLLTSGTFDEGDIVCMVVRPLDQYETFKQWWITNTVTDWLVRPDANGDGGCFYMPSSNVTIRAEIDYNEPEGPYAQIRFTWEGVESGNIFQIAVSDVDVEDWYETVFDATYLDALGEEIGWTVGIHGSDSAHYPGSDLLPSPFFTYSDQNTANKGAWFDIEQDMYSAICTVVDPQALDTFDIVANYDTRIYTGDDTWFEVFFDVGKFLAGVDDGDGWVLKFEYDNPDEDEYLLKGKSKSKSKLLRKIVTKNVTYYVLRR